MNMTSKIYDWRATSSRLGEVVVEVLQLQVAVVVVVVVVALVVVVIAYYISSSTLFS